MSDEWFFVMLGTLAATDEITARRALRALLRLINDSELASGVGGHAYPPIDLDDGEDR
jgi:hypothetical protein